MRRIVISLFIQSCFFISVTSLAQTTLKDMFVGEASGVFVSPGDGNPNGKLGIYVRGVNSLRADGNPIWIVDGVVLNSSINQNLNPFWKYDRIGSVSAINDVNFISEAQVESIEILKGAAATSLYGSLGSNGVVIVKTKRGNDNGLNFNWNTRIDAGNQYFRQEHTAFLSHSEGRKNYGISAFFNNSVITNPKCGDNIGGFKANFETQTNDVIWFGVNSIVGFGNIDSANSSPFYGRTCFQTDYSDRANDIRNLTSAYVQFNIYPYLNLKLDGGVDYHNQSRFIWYGKSSDIGKIYNGVAGRLGNNLLSYNGKLSINFSRYIVEGHLLETSIGAFANGGIRKSSRASGNDFAISALEARGISMATSKDEPYDFDSSCGTFGAEVKTRYSFHEFLNLSAALVSDNTPKFDKWKAFTFYPSASVSFDIHKALFSDYKPISSLSIEGGYGKSGREYYIPTESYHNFSNSAIPEIAFDRAVYYDAMDRMRSRQMDAKAKIGFASDMFVLGIGWYDKSTSEVLCFYDNANRIKGAVELLEYGERKELSSHEAIIANKGIELDADFLYANNKNWSLGFTFHSAYNVNQIIKVDKEEMYAPQTSGLQTSTSSYGLSVGSFIGYNLNENGQYADLNGDGKISGADKVVLGNPFPSFYGSFSLYATYKSFALNAQFNGAAGFETLNINEMLADNTNEVSSKYVKRGDYLNLSRVDISYHLNKPSVKWLKGASVALGLRDILTFSSYNGTIPAANCWPEHAFSAGLDYGTYPIYKAVMIGFNLKF